MNMIYHFRLAFFNHGIYSQVLPVLYTCIATFFINLPFGYFRGKFKELSFLWFLMIHLPVPLIIWIRHIHHLRLTWGLAPFLIGSFFLGQWVGRKAYGKYPIKKT